MAVQTPHNGKVVGSNNRQVEGSNIIKKIISLSQFTVMCPITGLSFMEMQQGYADLFNEKNVCLAVQLETMRIIIKNTYLRRVKKMQSI